MIYNLYSKRQKRLRGEFCDVYSYKNIPEKLKIQIIHLLQEACENVDVPYDSLCEYAAKVLRKEYGRICLSSNNSNFEDEILKFLILEYDVECILDFIEVSFDLILTLVDGEQSPHHAICLDMILELNERFKENGVGYQFESGEIIRVDSDFIHAEAVKPALAILRDEKFHGANEEFLSAHEHYRHKRYKECLVEACKALESTLKTVCELREWPFTSKDTASKLIGICFEKNLFPAYLESQFSAVRSVLESGLPTIRNKEAGHGQGTNPVEVPEYFARYALNLTATTVLFILEAHRATK